MSIKTLGARLQYLGGDQLGRLNRDKLRSFKSSLKNSYQSRLIKTKNRLAWPCLINNNEPGLKNDYDRKYLSVQFESGLESGDTFEVLDDKTHWMIYLPILTETAYLRTEIIRCRYQLEINDEIYWIYFQGPTETDLRWILKHHLNYNELNLSGTIYIKNNSVTKEFFKRFTKIKIDGHVWEVQVTDSISVPGIIELEVQEYYDNPIEELPEVIKMNDTSQIIGTTSVKQDDVYGYQIQKEYCDSNYNWKIAGNDRVKIEEVYLDGSICKIKVEDGAIGSFTISYTDGVDGYNLEVEIETEDNTITGPQEVYPYDTIDYTSTVEGSFMLDTKLATIIEQTSTSCKIEILTSRTGNFNLYFMPIGEDSYRYIPIQIKSLLGGKNEDSKCSVS